MDDDVNDNEDDDDDDRRRRYRWPPDVSPLSQFVIVRWLDCLVVWIGNGFPVDSRAALLPTPLLACMIDTR